MRSLLTVSWLAPVVATMGVGMLGALLAPRHEVRRATDLHGEPVGSGPRRRHGRPPRPIIEWLRSSLRRRRPRLDPTALGSWIDDLSTAVRRGITLRLALLDVHPTDDHLDTRTEPLRHALQRGAAVPEATRRWTEQLADAASSREQRHLVATASVLGVAAEVGGSVSQPLDRLAAAMRLSAADDLERAAQSAQARMSARVLTLLPLVVLSLLVAVDRDVRSTIGSAPGLSLVSTGIALNLVGAWWMSQIIDRDAR